MSRTQGLEQSVGNLQYLMGLNASSQRNNKKCLPFKDVNNYLKSLIRYLQHKLNKYFARNDDKKFKKSLNSCLNSYLR
jgi:hypothetical protein